MSLERSLERVVDAVKMPGSQVAEEAFELAVWAEGRMNELLADPKWDPRTSHALIAEMRGYRSGCLAVLAYASKMGSQRWLDECRQVAEENKRVAS